MCVRGPQKLTIYPRNVMIQWLAQEDLNWLGCNMVS